MSRTSMTSLPGRPFMISSTVVMKEGDTCRLGHAILFSLVHPFRMLQEYQTCHHLSIYPPIYLCAPFPSTTLFQWCPQDRKQSLIWNNTMTFSSSPPFKVVSYRHKQMNMINFQKTSYTWFSFKAVLICIHYFVIVINILRIINESTLLYDVIKLFVSQNVHDPCVSSVWW